MPWGVFNSESGEEGDVTSSGTELSSEECVSVSLASPDPNTASPPPQQEANGQRGKNVLEVKVVGSPR